MECRLDIAIKNCRGMYCTERRVPVWEDDQDWKIINKLQQEGKL